MIIVYEATSHNTHDDYVDDDHVANVDAFMHLRQFCIYALITTRTQVLELGPRAGTKNCALMIIM